MDTPSHNPIHWILGFAVVILYLIFMLSIPFTIFYTGIQNDSCSKIGIGGIWLTLGVVGIFALFIFLYIRQRLNKNYNSII